MTVSKLGYDSMTPCLVSLKCVSDLIFIVFILLCQCLFSFTLLLSSSNLTIPSIFNGSLLICSRSQLIASNVSRSSLKHLALKGQLLHLIFLASPCNLGRTSTALFVKCLQKTLLALNDLIATSEVHHVFMV
jgi:hypothetical protein